MRWPAPPEGSAPSPVEGTRWWRLGAFGQIFAGLLVVAGAILLFIGGWVLFRWLFGY